MQSHQPQLMKHQSINPKIINAALISDDKIKICMHISEDNRNITRSKKKTIIIGIAHYREIFFD